MTLTLLLDLDDTLLNNDIDTFLPGYLKALSTFLADRVPPQQMVKQLLNATDHMVANNQPMRTLEETFDGHFYPGLGIPKPELVEPLADFYANRYPELHYLTSPRPEAVRMVKQAFERGYQVVIATNPLFPAEAIYHRLRWANLSPEEYPFQLITSFEKFHFSKPNPAFYAEVLAQIGWPEQPAVMVGNSLSDDLLPATQLGLPGFWISSSPEPLPLTAHPLSAKGGLEDLPAWLKKMETPHLSSTPSSPAGLLAELFSTPAALDTLSRGMNPNFWNSAPQPGEWCFTEVICHLRDSDQEINMPRLEKLFAEENPFLPAVNADEWSTTRHYCSEDGPEALRGFSAGRLRWLERLKTLTEQDWQKKARHAIFGPTTLQEMVSFTAAHDRNHIQQAIKTLKSQGL